MTHPARTVWSDAEALFTFMLSWTNALPSAVAAVGQTCMAWGIEAAVVLAVVGLALGARAPKRPRPVSISPTLPVLMTRTLLLLAAVLVAAPAFAQTHAEAMARLAPYAGSYSLDGTAEMPEGASENSGTFGGTLAVSPVLDGHFQQWDWEMTMNAPEGDGPRTIHLRFLTTYDTETGDYAIWRFDVRDIGEWAREGGNDTRGTLRFDGDALVMAWPTTSPYDPSWTGVFRNTVHLRDGGIVVDTDVRPDDGSPSIPIVTTRASRR